MCTLEKLQARISVSRHIGRGIRVVLTRQRDGSVQVSHVCGSEVSGEEDRSCKRELQEKNSTKESWALSLVLGEMSREELGNMVTL